MPRRGMDDREMPEEAREFVEKLREFVQTQSAPQISERPTIAPVRIPEGPDLFGSTTITVLDSYGEFMPGDILTTSNGFARLHRIVSASETVLNVEKLGFFHQIWWWVRHLARRAYRYLETGE